MMRRKILALIVSTGLAPLASIAQAPDAATTAALHDAVAGYVAAWNTHDVAAWSAWLTDDVEWVDVESATPRRGRSQVVPFASYYVTTHDLALAVRKVVLAPDGRRATVLLSGRWLELPKKDGHYAREWTRSN